MTHCYTNLHAQLLWSIILQIFSAVCWMTFSGRLPSCVFCRGRPCVSRKEEEEESCWSRVVGQQPAEWITCDSPTPPPLWWGVGHKTKAVDRHTVPIGRYLPWCREGCHLSVTALCKVKHLFWTRVFLWTATMSRLMLGSCCYVDGDTERERLQISSAGIRGFIAVGIYCKYISPATCCSFLIGSVCFCVLLLQL